MSTERLHPPDWHALELLRRHPLWDALASLVIFVRRSFAALRRHVPEPDTSIAWEDGEVGDDREARG